VPTVARFTVEFTQYLDEKSQPHPPLPDFAADAATLLQLHRAMVLTRVFDNRAISLQRTGKLGTFASSLGQEAVGVGVASAMTPDDVLLPYYRDHGAQFLRGVSMKESLLYWGGDERGSAFAQAKRDFPNCVPIGTQIGHATGVAYAMKLRKKPQAAVCLLGDGCTSKGDFYEGMNIAGASRLPLLFVVSNNQWAISVPRKAQTAAETLAQKAIAAGIEGVQVDGNDVIAVRDAANKALEKARAGAGPTVIEALTYRLGDHTTADDASRYRDAEELKSRWQIEPIARLRNYLVAEGHWDKEREERLLQECTEQVNREVEAYMAEPSPPTGAMFDYTYAELPEALKAQRESGLQFGDVPHG
jgi:2-oxoisovalerate dehydrogenase E1 component alpha subunit